MAMLLVLQAMLGFDGPGVPVRFGAPLSRTVVERGLALRGRGVLQWRRLPVGAEQSDPVWVEIAVVAPRGRVEIVGGAEPPDEDRRGMAFVHEVVVERRGEGEVEVERWRWVDGTVDERQRTTFSAPVVIGGETFGIGEARTLESPGLSERADVLLTMGRGWPTSIGLLPPAGTGGTCARGLRRRLTAAVEQLRELPGLRGAGDYLRSDGVVTNLEYDTIFALLRTALGERHQRSLTLARRGARQLLDRDLDPRSGLVFAHGSDHRVGAPQLGHVWVRGLTWMGLLSADDAMLSAAHNLARALAVHLPEGTGRQERLRDFAWPLAELEAAQVVWPGPALARAADRLALSIVQRFDATAGTFRFGEGEVGGGVYFERGWLTAGLLLPALRAHHRRCPGPELQRCIEAAEANLLARIGRGAGGLPTHWRTAGGRVFAEHRESGTAAACFLLDGLADDALGRLLRRSNIQRAVGGLPDIDDPDLPTTVTLLARCDWVWQ